MASSPSAAALAGGVSWLEAAGFRVEVAGPRAERGAYTAGSDEERAAAIHALVDNGARALIAARGGYGVMRVLPLLDWDRLAAWGGWVVGFSDITALHAALAARSPVASLHGPLAVTLRLGQLTPNEVVVQACYGPMEADGKISRLYHVPMKLEKTNPDGTHRFTGAIPCQSTGRHGYTIRVLPHHPDLDNPLDTGLILWG